MSHSSTSPFATVEMAPRDPILGLTEAFNADTRSNKVNLGVGVYYDNNGKVPLLSAVKTAEQARLTAQPARSYQPIDGLATYNQLVQQLVFGKDSPLIAEGRILTIEALGGTGALKVGGDWLHRLFPDAKIYISDPSWENHRALFETAGLVVESYPYYDANGHGESPPRIMKHAPLTPIPSPTLPLKGRETTDAPCSSPFKGEAGRGMGNVFHAKTRGVDFVAMKSSLDDLPARSIVLLHACCHNPTGADLTPAQWKEVVEVVQRRSLIPFIDMAYQGFAEDIEPDAMAVRLFAEAGVQFLVSSSFSKSFSLYGERVGALSVVTASREESARVLSQIKRIIRTNYSNPPTHGGAIVAAVLANSELRAQWEAELADMRHRIHAVRIELVAKLKAQGVSMDFIAQQRGMFSYTGLTPAEVDQLQREFGIYAVSTGRICLAALNDRNINTVANAIAAVLGHAHD
ncbi:MAG: amino acid aminotransferase [Rhodocyclaceae bacterium]|nr:amino acid aminotransferase [Rhodocyclaceae bacterium]